jgi:hypothetical protein
MDIHLGDIGPFAWTAARILLFLCERLLAGRSDSRLAGAVLEIVNKLESLFCTSTLPHFIHNYFYHYFYHSTNEPTSHILFDYTTTRSTKQQKQYPACLVIKTSTTAHASVNDSANVRTTWRLHLVQSSIPAGRPRSSSLRVMV